MLKEFSIRVHEWTLVPGSGGAFEVVVDGVLVYSKLASGRHPAPEEIRAALLARLPAAPADG